MRDRSRSEGSATGEALNSVSRAEVAPPPLIIDPPPGRPSGASIGLVITTYNRPHLAALTLASVARSQLTDAALIIVDDCSDDPRTLRLVRRFDLPQRPVVKVLKRAREGFRVHESLRLGWDLARERFGCRWLVNLDADALVRRDWLARLHALHQRVNTERAPALLTGFNARHHRALEAGPDHRRKASLGGLNLFFDTALYETLVRPNLASGPWGWDWRLVEAARERGVALLCTRPSVVQHIGALGWWSGPDTIADFAPDYWGASWGRETLAWAAYRAAHALWRAAAMVRRRTQQVRLER